MGRANWRSGAAYEHLRAADAPAIAWEFLSRNARFEEDKRSLEAIDRHRAPTADELNAFAQRWGVRFRQGRRGHSRSRAAVDDGEPAERYPDISPPALSRKPRPQT